jgi:hypothetical protein
MSELIHALTLRVQMSGERAARTILGYLAVVLLLVFAFAAFVYAAATALTGAYGPVVSALVLGGVSVGLAVIVVIWLAIRSRRLKRERQRMQRIAQPAMAGVAASALPLMMRTSPIGTLVVVALAGYMLQRSTQKKR